MNRWVLHFYKSSVLSKNPRLFSGLKNFRSNLSVIRSFSLFGCLALLFFSCEKSKEAQLFKTLTAGETGLAFSNNLDTLSEVSILDYLYFYNGGGVAVGDLNNDQLPDVYFTSNMGKNKLFLNKGNFKFEDVTEKAGVAGKSDWNSGVVMADVNGDGNLDIYVCAVVGINGFEGKNELFINNADGTFTEASGEFGLDFETYSSSAAFFDYDNDGDLDMYLLNHAVHSVNSFGPAKIREKRVYESGDKLLRNDNNYFVDVSEEAGIFGGYNSYGLGVVNADFNLDGFTDIYVCNDFHEDDYFYLNNGDGTFTESIKDYFGHTSRFSMGNDVADINHDGLPDLISLDMLPEDEKVLKASDGDEGIDVLELRINQLQYHYQFTRNMLQINQGDHFVETALYSGVAATDWSWSALFADYNSDGEEDLFVFTGIPKRPNDLDYIKYLSNEEIQKKINQTNLVDREALKLMPSGVVKNYLFEGQAGIKFKDRSDEWIKNTPVISNGAALADFDNDGDLDVITNNLNQGPFIYQNRTDSQSNYLKIKLRYKEKNLFGTGTKVLSYHQGILQSKQMFTTRGFQSSSDPVVHFGYGVQPKVDSLLVVWPDNSIQKLIDVQTDQTLEIAYKKNLPVVSLKRLYSTKKTLFKKVSIDSFGIDYAHKENRYTDFNRQKLIPYKISDKGPAVAVGDLNQDGLDDLFFGSSIYGKSEVYFQKDGKFEKSGQPNIEKDSLFEDIDAAIADFNKDGNNDLYVLSSGGEYYRDSKYLLDRIYSGKDEFSLAEAVLPEIYANSSVVRPCDFDQDGDLDLFVGGGYVSFDFGKIPESYLLENTNGRFEKIDNAEILHAGMITDARWSDIDLDGDQDLVVVGEWMSPTVFLNDQGRFIRKTDFLETPLNGLWQQLEFFDIDQDGDLDIVLGNWGLNSKFKASKEFPMQMIYGDIDQNKTTETIISIEKGGKYYPLMGLDEMAAQLTLLKKKFNDYASFAGKTTGEIFDQTLLENTTQYQVHELASGYLLNTNGKYTFKPFSEELQLAPLTRFLKADFDGDGKEELLCGGNFFGVIPFHGRFDAFQGYLIKDVQNITATPKLGLNLFSKMVRGLKKIKIGNRDYLLVVPNNEKPELYLIEEN